VKKAFYSDEEDHSEEETIELPDNNNVEYNVFTTATDNDDNIDVDHQLVLKSSLPLLKSRNSGVVLAVCTLHYYCGAYNNTTLVLVAKALVRVLRNRREVSVMLVYMCILWVLFSTASCFSCLVLCVFSFVHCPKLQHRHFYCYLQFTY